MNRSDRYKKHHHKKDRWSSVDNVIDRSMNEIDDDAASLHDFFMYCRRHYSHLFKHMSMEEFTTWNHQRLEVLERSEIETATMSGTMLMANKVLLILLQELGGVPDDTVTKLVSLKNALVEDYEAAPSDTASRLIYEELKQYAQGMGLRVAGMVTPIAAKEIEQIRKNCKKTKVLV